MLTFNLNERIALKMLLNNEYVLKYCDMEVNTVRKPIMCLPQIQIPQF